MRLKNAMDCIYDRIRVGYVFFVFIMVKFTMKAPSYILHINQHKSTVAINEDIVGFAAMGIKKKTYLSQRFNVY